MAQPFQPNLHPEQDQGIPAADPGVGAPETAPGFGIGGEEPSAPEPTGEGGEAAEETTTAGDRDTVFRTPDPSELNRDE